MSKLTKALAELAKRADAGDEAAQAYRGQRISTRVPTAKSATENFLTDNLIINRKSLEDAPKAFDINTEFVSRYPTVKTDATTAAGRADAFTAEAVDNLIWLYNQAPPAVRNIGKNWYVGANRIAGELAEKYGISHESASAVLAALSPQKDWYQNVSLAERVINGYKKSAGKMLDADSLATAREIYSDPKFANNIEAMANMPFDELDDVQKAMYVRSLDQTHNDRGYQMINPNGDRVGQAFSDKTGKPNTTAWGSNSEIAKAIRVIEDPSIENISRQMGGAHKVRNFYNNISDPTYAIDNPELGDVTIDTHAVAADQIMPLSGNSVPVGAAFGTTKGVASSAQTGARGTYGLHADAYRIAARELGIQPRELQSVTWETVRSLFPASFKTKGNVSEINGIWELYNNGKISKGLARELILDKAGGIPDPDWAAGLNTAASGPRGLGANTGELSFSGVPGGQTAGRSDAGRNLIAAGFSTGFLGALGIGYTEPAQAGPISSGIKRLASAYEKVTSPQAEGVARMVEQGQISPEQADKYTNTIKAYKLFRTKGGNTDELFPLFVNANKPVKMGEWNPAESGSLTDAGKVKSSIGPLAYRPGWHAGDAPVATHIGGKSDSALKAPDYRPADQVWAEVEMPADVDWQSVADSRMEYSKAGKPIPRTAQITDQIPEGGYYRYKTNPNMTGDWLIAGDMKVNRILTPSEVYQINAERGVHDLPPVDENGKMLWSLVLGSGLVAAGVAPEKVKAELLSEVPQEQAQQLQDNWSQIEANAQAGLGGMGVRMPPTAEDEEAMLAPTGGDLMQQANRDFVDSIRTQPEPDLFTSVQQQLLSGIMKTAGVADLSADVVSAMAGPLLSAPGAIGRYVADRYVPGVNYSAEEMAQGRRETEDYFNYQPRTELGPQYGEQMMQGIGGAIAPYVPAIKKAAGDSYILGAMRQGYDYLGEREKELAKALMDLSPI